MNSNIVLQFKCQSVPQTVDEETLRNGINTNTPKFTAAKKKDETSGDYDSRKNKDKDINSGLHESWDWYEKCSRRERNQGEVLRYLNAMHRRWFFLSLFNSVPENIHTVLQDTYRWSVKIPRGRGVAKAKFFKETYEVKLEILEGGAGCKPKKPSKGGRGVGVVRYGYYKNLVLWYFVKEELHCTQKPKQNWQTCHIMQSS